MAGGRDPDEKFPANIALLQNDSMPASPSPKEFRPEGSHPEGSHPEGSHSEESHPWLAWAFKSSFLLLAHTISSVAISLAVALAINGYNAIDTSTPRYFDGKLHLRVSDVTTLVSVGLVINRFFTTAWAAITIWKFTVILEHHASPKLSDRRLLFMEKYKLPPWAKYPFQLPGGRWSWIIFLILLCILPQQFIAPLISGAVNWNPAFVPGSARILVNSTNPDSISGEFEQYTGYGASNIALRSQVISRALGFASLAWSDNSNILGNGTSLTGNGCRHVVNDDGLTSNSTLLNSIVPCIKIHSIDWQTSPSSVYPADFSQLSVLNNSLWLDSNVGQIMLFNPDLLWNSTTYPVSTPVSSVQTLSVSITKVNSFNNCTNPPPSFRFGNLNNISPYLSYSWYCCYGFANVTITAGVTTSPVSIYLSSTVVEDQTPIDQVTIKPNKWVQEALWLLPDLMNQLSFSNSSRFPTWDNLDGYAENVIRQAYLAAWDALSQTFDDTLAVNSTISTAIPAVSRIQASVSNTRVFAWLGVSLLISVSGLLLAVLPSIIGGLSSKVMEEIVKEAQDDGQEILNDFWCF
ncbi:hypothetical protein L207DRAFT_519369 [Hyaloscypha variabilis F]|uniref:Transmembrane protein n=1 Tax=Hyaloscypha variabilis (strain UAMH 11265 / GT02V1 / F) TaxID=1149755 RepID=A0A2J6QZD9_HYAVF|nr:hypothetical protein L207DRAFT_519369 [Hyaloscypha variabilis F]